MKVPISWLKNFVDINLSTEELAERLTLAGLEVGSIQYVGIEGADLVWDREKLVLGHVLRLAPPSRKQLSPARPIYLNMSVKATSATWS